MLAIRCLLLAAVKKSSEASSFPEAMKPSSLTNIGAGFPGIHDPSSANFMPRPLDNKTLKSGINQPLIWFQVGHMRQSIVETKGHIGVDECFYF
jgi:hypothetical protein